MPNVRNVRKADCNLARGQAQSGYNKGTIRSDIRYLVASKDVRRHRLISIVYITTLPCHGRGREFESRRPHHSFQKRYATFEKSARYTRKSTLSDTRCDRRHFFPAEPFPPLSNLLHQPGVVCVGSERLWRPGRRGLRGHAAISNSNEIAGIMRRLLCTSRAPGTRICFLFAGSYPSYQLNWNVSSNQASAINCSFL